MVGALDDVLNNINEATEREQKAIARTKKVTKEVKKTETWDEALDRILKLKLKDDERAIVHEVLRLLKNGTLERLGTKRISKKEIMELYKVRHEQLREQRKQHVLDTRPSNYWVVQDKVTLQKIRKMLRTEPITAWDTETQGLDIYNHRIVGYSAYLPKHDIAFYVPFGHTTGQQQVSTADALAVAKEYLEDPDNKTIWHHYKFDGHMFLNHGIRVATPWWDTQVAAKLLFEHESHKLKNLHARYILGNGDVGILFEDLFDDFIIYDKDIILAGIYAAGDAHKTYQLYEFQKPHIDTKDRLHIVWYEIEQHLLQVDLAMERTGFRIDLEMLKQLEEKHLPTLIEAERQFREALNIDQKFVAKMAAHLGKEIDEFNIQSNDHLGYLVYEVLGVDPGIGKRFKKAARSTAAEVIDEVCKKYEELKPLLVYRQLNKLLNTYIRKIPQAMEPADGRLHSRFNNLAGDDGKEGTATGRYSSSEYVSAKNSATGDHGKGTNLQNIPSKGEGLDVRKCFIPDPGWLFVSSDLSQIEPRIISVILSEKYGDHSMRDMYRAGVDLYTEMAMQTFGFDRECCVDGAYDPDHTYQPRKLMKQGVLAYLYGQSAKSFARNMKVADEVAEMFFTGMTRAFPGLKPFREDTIKQLLTNGNIAYVETLFGRKRRFPDYRKNFAELKRLNKIPRAKMTDVERERRNELWRKCAGVERQSINTIIQGSAADVLKRIMIALYRFCVENGFKLHASIHDEVVISVPRERVTPVVIKAIDNIMTETTTFSTPLKCDTVIQPRWMVEIRPDNWDFEKGCPKVEVA